MVVRVPSTRTCLNGDKRHWRKCVSAGDNAALVTKRHWFPLTGAKRQRGSTEPNFCQIRVCARINSQICRVFCVLRLAPARKLRETIRKNARLAESRAQNAKNAQKFVENHFCRCSALRGAVSSGAWPHLAISWCCVAICSARCSLLLQIPNLRGRHCLHLLSSSLRCGAHGNSVVMRSTIHQASRCVECGTGCANTWLQLCPSAAMCLPQRLDL